MNDITQLFFELIRVAMGNQVCLSHTPSANEWDKLYTIAKKQSLVGVCFIGVQKLQSQLQSPPEKIYLTWMGMTAKIQQRNQTVNQQCVVLQKRLALEGFRSCILKGQGVAQLYEKSLQAVRQCGDIDVWVDAPIRKIMSFVNSVNTTTILSLKHVNCNIFQDTEVELHFYPVHRYNPVFNIKIDKYFKNIRKQQFENTIKINDNITITAPKADFQLAHQLLHIYNHYLYEGIGLRQFMDLYYTQIKCVDDFENSNEILQIKHLYEKLGLGEFVAAVQWVLVEVFDFPYSKVICVPNPTEGRHLLDDILIGGNFGHYNINNNYNKSFTYRMWRRIIKSVRMARFDFGGMFYSPFYRLFIALWRMYIRHISKVSIL